MTDDNKKTPTDDKITELSAWQKRNKEYLEKKALEKTEESKAVETEREEAKENEDLSEKEIASVSEEETDEIKESEEENKSEVEEDPETDGESSDGEKYDPAIEELDHLEKQVKKPSFFERLKTKKSKKEPAVEKRHIYRALPVLVISSLVALLSLYFLSPLSTQKVIEFSGNKVVDQQQL